MQMDLADALVRVLEKRSPKLKGEAATALGEFADQAETVIPALRTAALGADCPDLARAALEKIAPDLDVDSP
jgi:hypothetical protein